MSMADTTSRSGQNTLQMYVTNTKYSGYKILSGNTAKSGAHPANFKRGRSKKTSIPQLGADPENFGGGGMKF